jgi:hypothetical protein
MKLLTTISLLVLAVRCQQNTVSPTTTLPPTRTASVTCSCVSAPTPSPTRSYQQCSGFTFPATPCPSGYKCIDDPRVSGCGMACDFPGICVPNDSPQCAGLRGLRCPEVTPGPGFECYDDRQDSCDPLRGGRDCMGICLRPLEAWEKTQVESIASIPDIQ